MLETILQLGDAVEHRGVVLAPLFPRRTPGGGVRHARGRAAARPAHRPRSSDAGSVPELAVTNPLDANVLLYDGEELLGAKQNRILNVTVLVGAQSTLAIPVSCVEEGRWSRSSASFASAPHAAHPELRRRKAQSLSAEPLARGTRPGRGLERGAGQVRPPGRPLADRSAGGRLPLARGRAARARAGLPAPCPDSAASLLALGDDLCLDYVSRPAAFARLYPKLRAGYLLDALERLDGKPAAPERLGAFVESAGAATRARQRSAGLGEDVRLHGEGVVGSGLELDGELLQLCAFTSDERSGRIARPSRRR